MMKRYFIIKVLVGLLICGLNIKISMGYFNSGGLGYSSLATYNNFGVTGLGGFGNYPAFGGGSNYVSLGGFNSYTSFGGFVNYGGFGGAGNYSNFSTLGGISSYSGFGGIGNNNGFGGTGSYISYNGLGTYPSLAGLGNIYTTTYPSSSSSNQSSPTQPDEINNKDSIKVKMDFNQPLISKITIDGQEYDRLTIEGLESLGNPGEPVLPIKSLKIFIPPDKEVAYTEVIYGREVIIEGAYFIEPGQREVPLSEIDDFIAIAPNEDIYESNQAFPGQVSELITKQKLSGYNIEIYNLYPVKYEPQKGKVSYYKNLTLVVNLKPIEGSAYTLSPSDETPNTSLIEYIENRIKQFVDNPDTASAIYFQARSSSAYTFAPTELPEQGQYEYIIITSSSLEDSFQPLIDSKINRNLTARIVTTQYIYNNYDSTRPDGSSDSQTKIRNFIKDAHYNWGTKYVLLGGDTEVIPCRILRYSSKERAYPTECKIASDLYYACLDGDFDYDKNGVYGEKGDGKNGGEVDLIAEVYIGRAPVDSIDEAENFVSKTLLHQNLNNTLNPDSWRNIMVGEWLGFGGIAKYAKSFLEEIRLGSNAHGHSSAGIEESSIQSDVLYEADSIWSKTTLIGYMNDSKIQFYNHLGHSSLNKNMKLRDYDVNNLTNPEPFFVYTQGCYAASFDNKDSSGKTWGSDCIAELFVNSPNAAFAFIGNTRYGWGEHYSTNSSSNRFHRHFWNEIIGKGIKQLGRANQQSKEVNIGFINQRYNRWCYYQITLLGDPEISIGTFDEDDGGNITPQLSVTPHTRNVNSSVGTTIFTVDNTGGGNMNWYATVTSGGSWLEIISGSSGVNSGTIRASYEENPSYSERKGTIRVTASGAIGSPITLTINQEAQEPPQDKPNLIPYKPSDWDDKIVVSNIKGTYSDASDIIAGEPAYIDIAYANLGQSEAQGFKTKVYINNQLFKTYTRSTALQPNYYVHMDDIEYTFSSSGNYTIKIVCDAEDSVIESNEEDNEYSRTIHVKPKETPPQLTVTPQQVEVSSSSGEINFKVSNSGGGTMDWYVSSMTRRWIEIESGMSGTNSGTIRISYQKNIESKERTGIVTVTAKGAIKSPMTLTIIQDVLNKSQNKPNLTPFKFSGWDDKIVLSNTKDTHTDDPDIIAGDLAYIDIAYANLGQSEALEYKTKVYVNNQLLKTYTRSTALYPNYYAHMDDIEYTFSSSGYYTVKVICDAEDNVIESNEGDNEYSKTIYVEPEDHPPIPPPLLICPDDITAKATGTFTSVWFEADVISMSDSMALVVLYRPKT